MSMHTGPEVIEMVHSGEGDPAEVRELTEASCSCDGRDGHPLPLWFPEWLSAARVVWPCYQVCYGVSFC